MINDDLHSIYKKLANERKPNTLFERYPGTYRAVVVETNDPLNMHRIRWKMPEMHNINLKPEECPWAVSAFSHGGKGTGSWHAPKIGDIVWITFEKQHPYGPIWIGHAEPTRRRFYKLHALFQETQVYVDEQGKPLATDPIEWGDYLPKDGRPYSIGIKDRYGNLFSINETGFVPSEHTVLPAPNGSDALSSSEFESRRSAPQNNNPDLKMMTMVTKYGHYMVMGDQGYKWSNDFSGDFDQDHELEKKREFNLIKTLNENDPSNDRDQRRIEFRTSYGHKFEMRDVGWAQRGPFASSSRSGDWFDKSSSQSDNFNRDERWLKLRTKGGHLIQAMDMGFDPNNDQFIRRNRIDEVGSEVDEEDNWQNRDARQIRFVTRYGFKFVLDDRGSDPSNAESNELPRGNGWLIKGRRDNKGYGIDVNEKDQLNRMMFYSPKSKVVDINDKYDYIMLCTDTSSDISEPWEKLKDNEFAKSSAMTHLPQNDTYHIKLDKNNNFIRLKTPANGGLNQGFESRNQGNANSVWTEMNDRDNRAVILNSTLGFCAIHDPRENKFILMDDNSNSIVVKNKLDKIQVSARGNVEIKSDGDIIFDAAGSISFKSGGNLVAEAAGTPFVVDSSGFGSTKSMFASKSFAFHVGCDTGGGAGPPSPKQSLTLPIAPSVEPPMTPPDRGFIYNGPFDAVDENVIRR